MQRTQIYLPTTQLKVLKKTAQSDGTTVSEVMRSLIQERFFKPTPGKQQESLLAAAKRIRKLGKGGPADLASNVDKYMYGDI